MPPVGSDYLVRSTSFVDNCLENSFHRQEYLDLSSLESRLLLFKDQNLFFNFFHLNEVINSYSVFWL